jgi:hypothetical protein
MARIQEEGIVAFSRLQTNFLIRVRVRHLRNGGGLRHASVKAILG